MVVFKLINAAIVLTTIIVLLLIEVRAVRVGDCHNDSNCGDEVLSAVSGNLKPNDEYQIEGPCPAFRSYVGPPNKVDVCSNTACTRLSKNQCYAGGPYHTVEVVE